MKHAREDYNRIQDPAGLIHENEPVLLIRAQDILSDKAADFYADLAEEAGLFDIAIKVREQAQRMRAWTFRKKPDLVPAEPQTWFSPDKDHG